VSATIALPPFWSLIERHGDELLAHARRLTDEQTAEDVLQDALLRALRAYPRLRHAEHLRAWLYRVTTTTALDVHRARRREVVTADPPVPAVEPEYDDGAFESLIAPLAQTAQDALRLRFVEDLDYDRIAVELGTSPEAARQRVSTAVRTLRERVSP
jgi:RNA polymerase sigma-70 factor, ECF subfamily